MESKKRYLGLVFLGLGAILALTWGLALSPAAIAQSGTGIIRVATTGNDASGCGAEANPCRTVQYAVDEALPGEEIRVATGVYTGVQVRSAITQVVFISKTVVVRGGYTPADWEYADPVANPTTLDAEGLGRVLVLSGTISPTIEGLRITGGNATGLGGGPVGRSAGGGVYLSYSDGLLRNNTIVSNTANTGWVGDGGGLYILGGAPVLEGNTIRGNVGSTVDDGYGGGLCMAASEASLLGNLIEGNIASLIDAGDGGGVTIVGGSTPLLKGNIIRDNRASQTAYGAGGGLFISFSSPLLEDNVIVDNVAGSAAYSAGGGLYLHYSDGTTLIGNRIEGNTASSGGAGYGGGLRARSHGQGLTLIGNTVQGNVASTSGEGYGGGLYIQHIWPVELSGNTIVSNAATLNPVATGQGGGLWCLYCDGVTMTNNVVAGNQANTEGSGLWFNSLPSVATMGHLLHNTLADNTANGGGGQGVFAGDATTLFFTNTIVSGHGDVGVYVGANSTVTLEATLWYSNGAHTAGSGTLVTGTVEVYDDPLFVDPAAGDYHLSAGSAAWDAGIDAGVVDDINRDPRPIDAGFDIGADEYRIVGLQFAPDRSAVEAPGTVVVYAHILTNTGVYTDSYAISYASSQGWAEISRLPLVVRPEGTATLLVSITVPADAVSGTVDSTVITATSQAYPYPFDMVQDTTTSVASQRQVYLPIVLKSYNP